VSIMSSEDSRLLFRHFGEDLEALDRHASGVNVTPSDLRQIVAPILRRWFVDDLIHRVQRGLGDKILIATEDLRPFLRACDKGDVRFFAGVNANINGIPVSNFMFSNSNVQPDIPTRHRELSNLKITDFARQRVLFGNEIFATRSDVIKFVANKWGGVHLDSKLTDEVQSMIDETRFYYGFKMEDGRLQMVVNVDGSFRVQKRSFPNDFLDLALLSLLNSAQALCRSLKSYKQSIAELAVGADG
jgi:hypothetical protein